MSTLLLVEPLIDGVRHGYPIQASAFEFSLRITNKGSAPSRPFKITKVSIASQDGQGIADSFEGKSFAVGTLNPGQFEVLSIGKNGQYMAGAVSVEFNVENEVGVDPISFQQFNSFTGAVGDVFQNKWIDFIYFRSTADVLQETTNNRLIALTWLIAALTFVAVVPILWKIWQVVSLWFGQF